MPAGGSSKDSQTDLAAMLAEMDSRLQLLQQELESVAVPIARRGSEPRRPARRPDSDPLAALSAEHQAHDGHQVHEDVQVMESEPPPLAPERPARPPRALSRAPRPPRPSAAPPPPTPAPFEEARMAEEARTAAELLPAPRSRAGRRGPAVARTRPTSPLEETPRRIPPTIAAAPSPAPPAPVAPPPPAAPTARSSASEAVVRQTILEAEEEARRVVDNARDRIAEIGARTRALLEHSLGPAPEPDPETAPAPTRRRRAGAHASRATPERRSYHGAVTVEAGPFADVGQLDEFEDALASVPGVEDVYIRTFERYYAHFELSIAEPTSLITELQSLVPEQLRLIDAGDRELRLEIVRDDADRTPRA